MEYRGASVYDDDHFFEKYFQRRNRTESPNDIIEKPILLEMIGDVKGKKVLDLGCGDAKIGVELLQKGCVSYDGVEGSENMVNVATKTLDGTEGKVHLSSMETWNFQKGNYDLVVSRLALHYLAEFKDIFQEVYHSIASKGRFIYSVQHPVLTSSLNYPPLKS